MNRFLEKILKPNLGRQMADGRRELMKVESKSKAQERGRVNIYSFPAKVRT
jgi:hypothetical protein